MFSTTGSRIGLTLGSVAAAVGMTVLTAGPASALTEKNGLLTQYEMGFYYNSDQGGCVFDIFYPDSNFSGDVFKGSCAGSGQSVNNNAASYHNMDVSQWSVYTGSDYSGTVGYIPAGYAGNASSTFKNAISSARPTG
ncbi:peptidase inhibitor family I36 protein [Streptomyces sp. NPDC053367]|uniref:peptidase inhibitor family I36 protein n=1 Tax=Streptomyces sp. NPDC053367 TaxID=3365700 RepID=UPI0037CD0287